MEPMALGSPSGMHSSFFQSPLSPMAQPLHHQQQQQGFLPNFLVGDHVQQASRYASPTSPVVPLPNASSVVSPPKFQAESDVFSEKSHAAPAGGPPTSGLLSSHNTAPNTPVNAATPTRRRIQNELSAKTNTSLFGNNVKDLRSPYDVREEVLNQPEAYEESNTWVTVFGFPPSAASYILSKFSQYGTILAHKSPPQGNWMHIKYQTRLQAQKALSKSESLIGGSLMIGVTTHRGENADESVFESNNDVSVASISSVAVGDRGKAAVNNSVLNRSSMRPLAQVIKDERDRASPCINAQANGGGIVGKAMEYIFGW